MIASRASIGGVLGLVCLGACTAAGSGGSAAGGAGRGGAGTGGALGAGGGAGGVGGSSLPGSPVTVTDRWSYRLDGENVFRGPAFAALPSEAAVAYVTGPSGSDVPWHLQVQRIDASGARIGAALSLETAGQASVPVIAADDQRYIVCWSEHDQVHCASQTPGQNIVTQIYMGPGTLPTVVHGGAGWVLAWRTSDDVSAEVVLQKMRAPATARTPFEPEGAPVIISPAGATAAGRPLVAATETGYVLVGGAPVTAQWLDAGLQARGTAVDLGNPSINDPSVYDGAVAATDGVLAFAQAQPYGSVLALVDAGGSSVTKLNLNGGGKIGMRIGVCANGSTLAGFWPEWDGDGKQSWVFLHPLTTLPPVNPNGFSLHPVDLEASLMTVAQVGDRYFAALSAVVDEIEILSLGR
jgi:hypothetical protein